MMKILQTMTSEMNQLSMDKVQQQHKHQHPLERKHSDSLSREVKKTSLNLGEYKTSSQNHNVGGNSRTPNFISSRIEEGDEALEEINEKHLDLLVHDAQMRDTNRKYTAKSNENDELAFVVRNLQIKLQEVEEECMRYSIAMQAEVKEKRKLELRNADLSNKLADARQGLRDTQTALTNVQQATETLIQKRDQRDSQLHRVLAENKAYEARVYELETGQRNAENAVKTLTTNRDELIEKLQNQLGGSQDAYFKSQSENVRIKGEKTMLEAELESVKRKLMTIEMKSKQSENNLHSTYTAEIDQLEGRLKLFADKIEEGRAQEMRANDLQAEIRAKMTELKTLEGKLMNSENMRKEQDIRQQSLEAQLRSTEVQHRQLDMRHRGLEQEFARVNTELSAIKRCKGQSEEDMREIAMQNANLLSEKQELRQAVNTLENKLETYSEAVEMSKRQKRELERVNNQLDEAGRKIIDLERNHRILTDDCNNTENRIKGISQRMATLLARDGENRQIIIVANNRITELYNLARDMHTKFMSEELRADKLEKDFTGVVSKRLYGSVDVPYAAAPVVPLPIPMDAGSSGYSGSFAEYTMTGGQGSSTSKNPIRSPIRNLDFSATEIPLYAGEGTPTPHKPTPPSFPRSSSSQEASRIMADSRLKSVSSPGTANSAATSSAASSQFGSIGQDFLHEEYAE